MSVKLYIKLGSNFQSYKICIVSYLLALLRLTFRNTTRMKRVKEVLY